MKNKMRYPQFKELIQMLNDDDIYENNWLVFLPKEKTFQEFEKEINNDILNSKNYTDLDYQKIWNFCHCIEVMDEALPMFNDENNFYYKILNMIKTKSATQKEYKVLVKDFFNKPLPTYNTIIRKFHVDSGEYVIEKIG